MIVQEPEYDFSSRLFRDDTISCLINDITCPVQIGASPWVSITETFGHLVAIEVDFWTTDARNQFFAINYTFLYSL